MSGSQCIYGDTYCSNKYGLHTQFDSLSNSCKCAYSYAWNSSNTKCISQDDKCVEEYGSGSESDFGNNCKCKSGYIWNIGQTKCVYADTICEITYGSDSSYDYSSSSCTCDSGYVLNDSEDECIDEVDYCNEKIGDNSEYLGDQECGCTDGYVLDDSTEQCIEEEAFCEDQLGENSEYIGDQECDCVDGYSNDGDQCTKNVLGIIPTNFTDKSSETGNKLGLVIAGLITLYILKRMLNSKSNHVSKPIDIETVTTAEDVKTHEAIHKNKKHSKLRKDTPK